jgi:hypothetical protein
MSESILIIKTQTAVVEPSATASVVHDRTARRGRSGVASPPAGV